MSMSTLFRGLGVNLGVLAEFYHTVYATNLTPEKLRASKIPDSLLVNIVVKLTGEDGKEYFVEHRRESGRAYLYRKVYATSRSFVIDGVREWEMHHFKGIEANTVQAVEGRLGDAHYPKYRSFEFDRYTKSAWDTPIEHNIGRVIHPKEAITQVAVANFIDKYRANLPNLKVDIQEATFTDVPVAMLENSGLPKEDLNPTATYTRWNNPWKVSTN